VKPSPNLNRSQNRLRNVDYIEKHTGGQAPLVGKRDVQTANEVKTKKSKKLGDVVSVDCGVVLSEVRNKTTSHRVGFGWGRLKNVHYELRKKRKHHWLSLHGSSRRRVDAGEDACLGVQGRVDPTRIIVGTLKYLAWRVNQGKRQTTGYKDSHVLRIEQGCWPRRRERGRGCTGLDKYRATTSYGRS